MHNNELIGVKLTKVCLQCGQQHGPHVFGEPLLPNRCSACGGEIYIRGSYELPECTRIFTNTATRDVVPESVMVDGGCPSQADGPKVLPTRRVAGLGWPLNVKLLLAKFRVRGLSLLHIIAEYGRFWLRKRGASVCPEFSGLKATGKCRDGGKGCQQRHPRTRITAPLDGA